MKKLSAIIVVLFLSTIMLSSTIVMFLNPDPTLNEVIMEQDSLGRPIALTSTEAGKMVAETMIPLTVKFDQLIVEKSEWEAFDFSRSYNQTVTLGADEYWQSFENQICNFDEEYKAKGCYLK